MLLCANSVLVELAEVDEFIGVKAALLSDIIEYVVNLYLALVDVLRELLALSACGEGSGEVVGSGGIGVGLVVVQ